MKGLGRTVGGGPEKGKGQEAQEASQRYCTTFPEAEGKPPVEEDVDKEKAVPMDLSGDQFAEERDEYNKLKRECDEKCAQLVQEASSKKARITKDLAATADKAAKQMQENLQKLQKEREEAAAKVPIPEDPAKTEERKKG